MSRYLENPIALLPVNSPTPAALPPFTKGREFLSFCIGLSGGVDSTVLLHYFNTQSEVPVRAIHINHGIHPESGQWANHCQWVCEQWNVDLTVVELNLGSSASNVEEKARKARFAAFKEHLKKEECLVLAHHAHDQAETVLMRLLKGAGPTGLSGMKALSTFDGMRVHRPFLEISKENIVQYAHQNQLVWIEDSSNQNIRFDRNYLRHDIVPLIEKKWPSVSASIARSALLCGSVMLKVEPWIKTVHGFCLGTQEGTLSVNALLSLPREQGELIIRYWLKTHHHRVLSKWHMEVLFSDVLKAKQGANPLFKTESGVIRRYRDDLYLVKVRGCNLLNSQGKDKDIRFRGQEGVSGKKIKKAFQAKGIPPWERDTTPLLYEGNAFIKIV